MRRFFNPSGRVILLIKNQDPTSPTLRQLLGLVPGCGWFEHWCVDAVVSEVQREGFSHHFSFVCLATVLDGLLLAS